jgi:Fe-S-cluster containining protein
MSPIVETAKPKGEQCCRAFFLNASHANITRSADALMRGVKTFSDCQGLEHPCGPDDLEVYRMVKKIGEGFQNPLTGGLYREQHEWFACRNLGRDGRCTIHDHRPQMCRDFTCASGPGALNFPHCPSKGVTCFPE